ncbi:MAG: hypothetical protein QME42_09100 [bacterium]|nr:hypothetical protein [bacterium]
MDGRILNYELRDRLIYNSRYDPTTRDPTTRRIISLAKAQRL